MLTFLLVLGVVALISAVLTVRLARELHEVSLHYPPAPVVIHCPGRSDEEIVERFIACCVEAAKRDREAAEQLKFDI